MIINLKTKAMKTKVSTLLAIWALGFIGLTNISAIADGKKAGNAEAPTGNIEMMNYATWITDKPITYSAAAFSDKDIGNEIEIYNAQELPPVEYTSDLVEFLFSADTITAEGADQEIEKYATKMISTEQSKLNK